MLLTAAPLQRPRKARGSWAGNRKCCRVKTCQQGAVSHSQWRRYYSFKLLESKIFGMIINIVAKLMNVRSFPDVAAHSKELA